MGSPWAARSLSRMSATAGWRLTESKLAVGVPRYNLGGREIDLAVEGVLSGDLQAGEFTFHGMQGAGNVAGRSDDDPRIPFTLAGSLEAVVGVLLFPLALIWFIPGAVFLGIIAIMPGIMSLLGEILQIQSLRQSALVITGAGLIIVVGVVIDTMRQLEAQLLMRHYEGFIS